MVKKVLRALFTLIGVVLGYGFFLLCKAWAIKNLSDVDITFTQTEQTVTGIIFAIIFGLIFYRLTPTISRQSIKMADNLEDDLSKVSANDLITGTIGLIVGLIIALIITRIYANVVTGLPYVILTMITYLIFGYIGIVVATKKGIEIIGTIITAKRAANQSDAGTTVGGATSVAGNILAGSKKKRSDAIPKIFDTSVIIDGRISEIMKTGFLEGPIVIPEFVLVELRHIADSSDSLKRTRGRRGLDILKRIQTDYGVEIYNTDSEKTLKEIPEVDVKLLKLAQLMNGKVVTNDFNLNKVAAINGVKVLNINELANTLKPMVLPGEVMEVSLVKQGKDNSQAIAYLDDGTMIVVEDGRKKIGETTKINVTSVLQTAAGRMIFGRLKY